MISKEEIEDQSKLIGVHTANVERDYVFGWLLKSFFENDYLAPLLVFKGGNCMRKAFYPNTRFSSDLDFSVRTALDPERFQAAINRACLAAQAACGVKFQTDRNTFAADRALDKERQSYKGKIYFWDFFDQPDEIQISVRLDVTEFDRLYLAAVTRPLIHAYSDADVCRAELQCMALEELLANKLKCLIQRRHSFDLYDLVYAAFFERSIEVDRGLVLNTFLKKTIFERSPGAAKAILLGLPMAFFRTAWEKYVAPKAACFDFDQASEAFTATIEAIFGPAPSGWGVEPFYPAEFRNLILDAGAAKKLMRISYDGHTREIEPYSLVYKRRQDGHASEYFYAWDRTGGSSRQVGIKAFFHHKIQALELLDQTFEPQFEIELSKAGEATGKGYFGKSFSRGASVRSTKSTLRRRTRSSFAPTYTVECPYCQKRFKRSRPSTALNAHADSNGYACPSRVGYLV